MNKVENESSHQGKGDHQKRQSRRLSWAFNRYDRVLAFTRKYAQLLTLSLLNVAYALVLVFEIEGIIPVVLSLLAFISLTHWWLMIVRGAIVQKFWVEVFVQVAALRGISDE